MINKINNCLKYPLNPRESPVFAVFSLISQRKHITAPIKLIYIGGNFNHPQAKDSNYPSRITLMIKWK